MLSEFFFSNSEREEQDDSSLAREQSREKVAEITEGMAGVVSGMSRKPPA